MLRIANGKQKKNTSQGFSFNVEQIRPLWCKKVKFWRTLALDDRYQTSLGSKENSFFIFVQKTTIVANDELKRVVG